MGNYIKSGYVVYSNISKAIMVVRNIDEDEVICNWFDVNNNLHEETFSAHDIYFVSK